MRSLKYTVVKKINFAILCTVFLFLPFFSYSDEKPVIPLLPEIKDHGLSHVFSLDLSYAFMGLRNNGWGIGINYEQKLFRYMSAKSGISHATFQIKSSDMLCTSVGISMTAFYYPFGKGLEWLYIGAGMGTDFLNYFGTGNPQKDVIISVIPEIGWKQMCFTHFMLDFYCGYKFIIQNSNRVANDADYVNSGFQFGVKVKILWRRVFNSIFK